MKILREAIQKGSYELDVDARDIDSILQHALEQIVARDLFPEEHLIEVKTALLAREKLASTVIGNAVAVPHAYLDALSEPLNVFVRLSRPVNLGAPDGVPTQFMFILLLILAQPMSHRSNRFPVAVSELLAVVRVQWKRNDQ